MALCIITACAQAPASPPALDARKVSGVVVGRSSRAEVFALLGRPSRVDRDGQGERWTWAVQEGGSDRDMLGTATQAASAIAGAFVPFAGLAGTGLGLARAVDGPAPPAASVTFTIALTDGGVVRDCLVSATAPVADAAGVPAALPDCQRPLVGTR